MSTRRERIAQIIHDEVVVHQTPGLTPFWIHQPESYRRQAVNAPIVNKIIEAIGESDD
jgi:hypothetical protein